MYLNVNDIFVFSSEMCYYSRCTRIDADRMWGNTQMDLLNMQVEHKSFGIGKIIEQSDSILEVRFESGTRKFVFPDAFGTFITPVDQEEAALVKSMKQKLDVIRREEEIEFEKQQKREYEAMQRALEHKKLIKNHKLSPASQAVFWCDEEEQERVFSEWRVFTGRRKSGENKGKPNRLIRLHQNSACLITKRTPDMPEEKRHITGFFMVNENFVGRKCEDGYIPAHSEFKIQLSEEESKSMLFWNYYLNERSPNSMTWNSGRHRYFDNVWMAQILRDIVEMKKGTAEAELMEDFYRHFCEMNLIVAAELPERNGSLVRANS